MSKETINHKELLEETCYILNHLMNDNQAKYNQAKLVSNRMLYAKGFDIEMDSITSKAVKAFKEIFNEYGWSADMYSDENNSEACDDCAADMNECNCSEEDN